jgi:predicted ribosome quality control (RQC) complex YloA/Tae2 family protein
MHIMSNLEYSFLVAELSRQLVGKHFSRIRKLGEGIYRMKISTSEILCELGVRLHATKYLEEAEESDKLTEKINKELDNAKLLKIEQLNNDRIVSFIFDKGSLVFEMFGEGNAVVVRDGKILAAAKYESWSDREIKAGREYKPPKTAPSEKLEISDKYIIVSLTKLPLGKEYALEALARAGIDEKTSVTSLSKNQLESLEKTVSEIRSHARAFAFLEAGKITDFTLAKLSKYKTLETREFATLSEAADEYYFHLEKPNPKLEKLLERLEKQEERLVELEEEEKLNRERGDYIYAHYTEAEQILALAKGGKFEEIEKRHAGKVDTREKSVEAEL